MRKTFSILAIAVLIITNSACIQHNNKPKEKPLTNTTYMSVDELLAKGPILANKTIQVEGLIEHVCHKTWKRFKIIGKNENHFIKIELGESSPPVDHSILGKMAKVTGKLIPTPLDEKMVLQWKKNMKENHKGEENTDHYKEEHAFIQGVLQRIASGEISFYTIYSVETESYTIE